MSAVYILWIRQLKRYYRTRSRVIGSLGQPLLFLLALGIGFGPVFQKAGEGNYLDFLTPGVIAMAVLFTAVFSGIEIIWDKQFGFLKETLVAPVSRFYIMVGRTLGGATVAAIQGIVVLIIASIIGFRMQNIAMLPLTFVYLILIALLFTALGTAIASILDDFQGFQLVMNFLVMPLFFLSGAIFPLVGLPLAFLVIASFDPLSYGVDGLRWSLTGAFLFSPAVDFLVLAITTAVLLAIGSYLFARIQI